MFEFQYIITCRRGFLGAPPKGSIHTSQKRLSACRTFRHERPVSFFLRKSSLPLVPLTRMLASSSILERVRFSPRHESGAPNRHTQSSPLSHSHTAGVFTSTSADTLLQDPQPRSTRTRREGPSWNIPWRTHRRGRESRRQPSHAAEDTFASRLAAFFGTCGLSTC